MTTTMPITMASLKPSGRLQQEEKYSDQLRACLNGETDGSRKSSPDEGEGDVPHPAVWKGPAKSLEGPSTAGRGSRGGGPPHRLRFWQTQAPKGWAAGRSDPGKTVRSVDIPVSGGDP